jgi:hypothetical protein
MPERPPRGGLSPSLLSRRASKATAGCHDVLPVARRRDKLEATHPDEVLDVVRVGPERVEDVVRADRDVGVVADEPEKIAVVTRVDRVRRDHVLAGVGQVPDEVVQSRVVDVVAERVAVGEPLKLAAGHFGLGHGSGAHAPDEYYVIESANPKIQGFDGAVMSFVEYLYELAK